MASAFRELNRKKLVNTPPSFVESSIQYEAIMGSAAYGVSNNLSDMDIYGFCIPPKEYVFPHLRGEIPGFGSKGPAFDQFQQHHVFDETACGGRGRTYDISVYSIVKFFQLCMDNNPNMIDSLFVPRRCVLFSTPIGETVRENRRLFLHKGAWHKFKGYAFSQVHKMKTKKPEGKRKAIIEEYFASKERELEALYTASTLRKKPDEKRIKELLLNCLEHHYGSLEACIVREDEAVGALREIDAVLDRVRGILGRHPEERREED